MNDWKLKPDESGDWIWVSMLSCNCCVDQAGSAHLAIYNNPDKDSIMTFEKSNKMSKIDKFWCHWESGPPMTKTVIHGWLKVELPDRDFIDNSELGDLYVAE